MCLLRIYQINNNKKTKKMIFSNQRFKKIELWTIKISFSDLEIFVTVENTPIWDTLGM